MIVGTLIAIKFVVLFTLLLLTWQLRANMSRYKSELGEDATDRIDNVPTVSLCIPARNETHALEDCLNSAIASDYPKLEILVLDDCSQDQTSQIIRGFAHDGVRFVQGETPPEDWLGKNNAYQTLASEARGDYLVFMSVDTRLEPASLSTLISYMQSNRLAMTSVLPTRRDGWRASVVLAPLRYFWQVMLPLRFNTPLATSLWAIKAETLERQGGFEVVKDKVMAENILASRLFNEKTYRFLIASPQLPVYYAKKWSSQADTAIRLWYPLLRKSILLCALALAAHFLLFVAPLVGIIAGLVIGSSVLFLVSFFLFLVQSLLFFLYLRQVQTGSQRLLGMWLLPMLAIQEMILILISIYQYRRGRVDWKGRNVCYPVLRYQNKSLEL